MLPFQSRSWYLVMYFACNWLIMEQTMISKPLAVGGQVDRIFPGLWNATTRTARLTNTLSVRHCACSNVTTIH